MIHVDVDKLVTLLLPTFMRKSGIVSILQSLVAPIKRIYEEHLVEIDDITTLASHSSQVCRMKDVLNKAFGISDYNDGFGIAQAEVGGEWWICYQEGDTAYYDSPRVINDEEHPNNLKELSSEASILADNNADFVVTLPIGFVASTANLDKVKKLVDTYRLVSRRPQIEQ